MSFVSVACCMNDYVGCFVSELDTEIIKAKRATRERPISFTKMDDIKNRWECTSQQGRRESQREARKEEIAGIRSRLFMVSAIVVVLFTKDFSSIRRRSIHF